MEFVMRSDERLPARQNKYREHKHYPCIGPDECCSVERVFHPGPGCMSYIYDIIMSPPPR